MCYVELNYFPPNYPGFTVPDIAPLFCFHKYSDKNYTTYVNYDRKCVIGIGNVESCGT